MATLVLTAIGDDRAGLVDSLSGVIADHGGSWDESHMTELAGKFAGIVLVSVADSRADALVQALEDPSSPLDITVSRATAPSAQPSRVVALELVGQDRPGIVHDISHALAQHGVSIDDLRTETEAAAMAGGVLFRASALLGLPEGFPLEELSTALEELADELMVDIDLHEPAGNEVSPR